MLALAAVRAGDAVVTRGRAQTAADAAALAAVEGGRAAAIRAAAANGAILTGLFVVDGDVVAVVAVGTIGATARATNGP